MDFQHSSHFMHFRIQPGAKTSIFVQNGEGEAARDETLMTKHFGKFPESQLTMLLDRCNRDVGYLHEVDIRYMAARVAALLKQFLDNAPSLDEPAEIVVPNSLRTILPHQPETMPVKEFITTFATKEFRA